MGEKGGKERTVSDEWLQDSVAHHLDNPVRDFWETTGVHGEELVFDRADLNKSDCFYIN